jgi:ABC-2 type transport system ATP-binding protein
MKRRLNIGCAIVHNPKLLILDEPTVGIDAQSRNHILNSIKELNAMGTTVIYSSHYMEEIESICNRIVIIDHGNIIERGKKSDILSKYNLEEKFQIFLNKAPKKGLIQAIQVLSGVISCKANNSILEIISKTKEHELKRILEIIEDQKYDYYSIDMKKNNLEDIFLQLTGRNLRD